MFHKDQNVFRNDKVREQAAQCFAKSSPTEMDISFHSKNFDAIRPAHTRIAAVVKLSPIATAVNKKKCARST